MAYLFNVKYTCNKMDAEFYIVNMIVGSYFANNKKLVPMAARCKMQYHLLSEKEQISRENYIIRKMESLPKRTLENISQLQYVLEMVTVEGIHFLWFRTGFEEIICAIDSDADVVHFEQVNAYKDDDFTAHILAFLDREKPAA